MQQREKMHFYGNVFEEKMSSVVLCILIPWSGPAQLSPSNGFQQRKRRTKQSKFNKPECIFMQFWNHTNLCLLCCLAFQTIGNNFQVGNNVQNVAPWPAQKVGKRIHYVLWFLHNLWSIFMYILHWKWQTKLFIFM